ncbi:uncharacterized protein BO95DRAFT_264831 [Aspergillus brunneoviolaceus CBS 621.78]|uniref:Uncharacterized protein n=1 Tax=Aspergillus brunneoviolaceus CBS 621.78 TaxID=1450534 RepID=A0ACD1FWY2_9EURO|nr:hypothetical protein BO95DRAFT_264831 [Aspergillus brunneoviolaceus CBS 621.78]RAH41484.1 hypothetical protein BO95DRAFT_264831 [Aspergillus brunneoviolaceus CBS 621.78]
MFLLTITVLCGAHLIPLVDLISENPSQFTLATCTFMTIPQLPPLTLHFRKATVLFSYPPRSIYFSCFYGCHSCSA